MNLDNEELKVTKENQEKYTITVPLFTNQELEEICKNYNNYIEDIVKAVQGLLNLYKEEKNKYSDDKIRETIIKRYHEVIEKDYVSKDKIRELLKEVQFTIQHESLDGDYDVLYYMTGIENSIKELLEEE